MTWSLRKYHAGEKATYKAKNRKARPRFKLDKQGNIQGCQTKCVNEK